MAMKDDKPSNQELDWALEELRQLPSSQMQFVIGLIKGIQISATTNLPSTQPE